MVVLHLYSSFFTTFGHFPVFFFFFFFFSSLVGVQVQRRWILDESERRKRR
jgi:hypothetical protein